MSLLWKPLSEKGALVVLFPQNVSSVTIKDASTGQVIEQGQLFGTSNDRAQTVRFSRPGSAYNNVIVETDQGSFYIDNGAQRRDGISLSAGTPTSPTGNAVDGPGNLANGSGGAFAGGGVGSATSPVNPNGAGFGGFGFGIPGVAAPILLDPNFVQSEPIQFNPITPANFNFTDPINVARDVGAFNREQTQGNFELGLERAREIQRQEADSIVDFASTISDFQQSLVGRENDFNQRERLDAVNFALPGVREQLERQRDRAETFASGRFLETAEDRAAELTARSASADGSFVRGFGDDSVVSRRQSDLLSAQQRFQIGQFGESLLNRNISQAAGLLVDQPLKTNISQRLPSQPNIPLGSLAQSQQQIENNLTTLNPATAIQANINQNQFASNLNQRTNEFNATNTFAAAQFNNNRAFDVNLQRLGILANNAQLEQNFQQSQFNAAASGEASILAQQNVQRQHQLAQQQQAQLAQAQRDFQQNRNEAQLTQSVAGILGTAINSPAVRQIVAGIINGGASILGFDPPFGSSTPNTPPTFGSGQQIAPPTPEVIPQPSFPEESLPTPEVIPQPSVPDTILPEDAPDLDFGVPEQLPGLDPADTTDPIAIDNFLAGPNVPDSEFLSGVDLSFDSSIQNELDGLI